ncbi:MAG: 16S rRNA (cytidine(1402)-2'-O)-methyltransferase [Gammaproteobacteria bacterium]|nr:16S rRNA (cytidine(1402)-2'-O)-methyltransferase [Gammaproteobacteria bacterium]
MSGKLYIVATPIGNLDDISLRAIDTLREVDLVAAEDTRHSQGLLRHLGLHKSMISLHEHNERERIQRIRQELEQGRNIALISDAGTPLISDPGFPLVRALVEAGLEVVPVPGASSLLAALCAAGLPTDHFSFHGFLPHKKAERRTRIEALKRLAGTQVLFESTHRILALLEQIGEVMPAAQLVVAKELTKQHERFIRGDAAQCLQELASDPLLKKGEFVVLIHQPRQQQTDTLAIDSDQLLRRLLQDLPLKKAVKLAVDITGQKKNQLYQRALQINDDNEA